MFNLMGSFVIYLFVCLFCLFISLIKMFLFVEACGGGGREAGEGCFCVSFTCSTFFLN